MAQTSKDGMRDLFRGRRNNFGGDAARIRRILQRTRPL
jgi:hypothetical protein